MRVVVSLVLCLLALVWCTYALAADPADETVWTEADEQMQTELMGAIGRAWDTPRRVCVYDAEYVSLPGPFSALIAALQAADVVMVGEEHDDPASHKLELELFTALDYAASNPETNLCGRARPVLAMEMFERDVQPVMDKFQLAGGTPEAEKTFLENSRPWGNYDPDYRFLVNYAAYSHTAFRGSNVPTPIARRVAKEGLRATLASLTPQQRFWVAGSTTSPKDKYWQKFLEAMGGGASADAHSAGMSEEQIYGFYQAQCLKDDTMAETIARLREEDPQRQVVHLSGSFHIDYHLGIYPRLVQRRPEDKIVTVALRPVENFDEATLQAALEAEPGVADYVVFVLREEPVSTEKNME